MTQHSPTAVLTDLERLIFDLRGRINKHDQGNILTRMRIVALNDMQRRLQEIRRLTAQHHLNLVFIGPVGVGKTTIICDLLGLRFNDGKKGEASFRNVLTTSAGRTTSCEVRILVRDTVRFDIEYHDDDDFKEMLRSFCLQHWQLAGHLLDEDVNQTANETQRVIRNLVGLKRDAATKQDAATELAKGFTEFIDFFEEVLSRYRAQERTQTELTYSGSAEEALGWIAKHFKKLNIGALEGFSLPKSISISIPRTLLHIPEDIHLDSVVDTKGLETSGPARQDIDDYISGGEYLCVFVDRFTDTPNNVAPTLSRHLHREALDTAQRCLLLVNTTQEAAAASLDDDGEYTSVDDGYAVKASQIRTALSGAKIFNFLDDHVSFYNPLEHFSSVQELLTLKQNSQTSDTQVNSDKVWRLIGDAVLRQDAHFRSQTEALKKRILSLESDGTLTPSDLARIQLVHTNIVRLDSEFRPATSSLNSFTQSLNNIHVSTFRAINNRYGQYNGNDVYYIAGDVSEQFFRNVSEKYKLDIERALQDLRASVSSQELRDCLGQFVDKLNADYQTVAKAIRIGAQQLIEAQIHPMRAASPSGMETFWIEVQGRWGCGSGYRDDVLSMYRNELSSIERLEPDKYRATWQALVTSPLLENLSVQ